MSEKLLLLKIKLELAKLKINESYRASNYLADIVLEMIVSGDDSKRGYLSAVNKVGQKYSIAHNSIVLGVSSVFHGCELTKDENFVKLNSYKKIKFVKDFVAKVM